jgi:transposase-like protein
MPRTTPGALEVIAGRSRWTVDDARVFVEAAQRSGMALREFAAVHSVDPHRLYRWSRELRRSEKRVVFAEVAVARPGAVSADDRIEVELMSGERVRLGASFDASALRRLLSVLDERRGC